MSGPKPSAVHEALKPAQAMFDQLAAMEKDCKRRETGLKGMVEEVSAMGEDQGSDPADNRRNDIRLSGVLSARDIVTEHAEQVPGEGEEAKKSR